MCEPFCFPCPTARVFYKCCHLKRNVPYKDNDERNTRELRAAYDQYNEQCERQKKVYMEFTAPVRRSTVCQALGCRRVFGRKGLFFCTEGCSDFCWLIHKKPGDPALPFQHRDVDDDKDASVVLRKVLGDPPATVKYTRWMYDEEKNENVLVTYPMTGDTESPSLDLMAPEANETGDEEPLVASKSN